MFSENTVHAPATPEIAPAFRPYPSRLFVETTTRCNLSCVMCMKQSRGSDLREGDLSPVTFASLEPALPDLEALVLNGIGEPLLNPRLEQFIRRGKRLMPAEGWIGFQSNGLLMTALRAISLVDAGLDRICFSLDGASPGTFRTLRTGGEFTSFGRALADIAAAKSRCGRPDLQVGVEFVAMRDNLRELPSALRWAASRGASFAIVSHILPYTAAHAGQALYQINTDAALSLFYPWQLKAEVAGVEIRRYFDLLWKYARSQEEQRIVAFVEAIKADARHRGVPLDLRQLLAMDYGRLDELLEVFAEAETVAREEGMDLRLPEAVPRMERHCRFVEQGGAFVSWDGKVHPCYPLWHGYCSHANGWDQQVRPRVFGDLAGQGIGDVWNSPAFRAFRENALGYDHPACVSCSLAPCDYLEGDSFEQDCYLNQAPCGSCLWGAGIFHCLS